MIDTAAPPVATSPLSGLSEAEAKARRQRGEGNDIRLQTSRSYIDIIRYNVFNIINVILFVIGAVMIAIGRTSDAITSVGVIALNVVVGVYQEVRAKRQLDQIALLTRPKISIMRDGQEKEVDPAELVRGDIILVSSGDQIVVDGVVVGEGRIDIDESLLTGEADLVPKIAGDEVLSGSFCVTGSATYEATKVGAESFANKLTATARKFTIANTPLQSEINLLLRLLMLLALFIGFLILIASILANAPFMRQVQMAAVIAGLVPNGLFFMVVLAYALGALRIAQQGALVQQSNAVESLSNVTVLCMDKTGTLTANKINFNAVYPVGMSNEELEAILGNFASSATDNNATGQAISDGLGGTHHDFSEEVPFSSARKWSGLVFKSDDMQGVYVLGAVEMLSEHMPIPDEAAEQIEAWSAEGLRVVVFGHNPTVTTLLNADDEPQLPDLTLLGVISFSDELRPYLRETLAKFSAGGITLKIISGDNPQTVAALAKQAGLPGDLQFISGPELSEMNEIEFSDAAQKTTVFGRITPDQKEQLVDALKKQGHYVAMIGDGVNDVLSLKKANLGIAMESGTSATRAVADMILLKDSFSALPLAFTEGQRIVNGMKDIMRLFLVRVLYSALLIIANGVIGLGFPFVPTQNGLLIFLSVGIPTVGLAAWSRPGPLPRRGMLREIANFVLPATATIFVFGLFVYFVAFVGGIVEVFDIRVTRDEIANFQEFAGIDYNFQGRDQFIVEVAHLTAQTALTGFTCFAGLLLVVFVEPPTQFFVGGDEYSGDIRPTLLAVLMFIIYVIVLIVPPLRGFFEMVPLPLPAYIAIGVLTIIWMLVTRLMWRQHWLERFLQVDLSTNESEPVIRMERRL